MKQSELILKDVISNVIAELAMMVVEEPEEWKDPPHELTGHIKFTGPENGKVIIKCSYDFAAELASNLLGISKEQITEAEGLDAIGELLNVICGNLVTELFGKKTAYILSVPIIEWDDKSNWSDAQIVDSLHLTIDGHPVKFLLITEQPRNNP